MRKASVIIIIAIFSAIATQKAMAQNYKSMPQNIKEYIARHFCEYTINHYDKEQDLFDTEYKVYVSNNSATFKLEFDKNGNIKKMESLNQKAALPQSVLPLKLTRHITSRFPQAQITEWKKKGGRNGTQVVELSNGVEMEFSNNGELLHVDD